MEAGSPDREVLSLAPNLKFLRLMAREALIAVPSSPLNPRFARFWQLIRPFARYLNRFHLFC